MVSTSQAHPAVPCSLPTGRRDIMTKETAALVAAFASMPVTAAIGNRIAALTLAAAEPVQGFAEALMAWPLDLLLDPLYISLDPYALLASILGAIVSLIALSVWLMQNKGNKRIGEEHGSARIADPKELAGFAGEKNPDPEGNSLLLSEHVGMALSRDGFSRIYDRNLNVLVVGGGRPIRPGAVALAQEGALYLQDVDRLSNTALKAVNGAWESVRIVRVGETVGLRTGFAPLATCEAGHEAAARSALQEICRGNAPYEATLPYVPDAYAILDDLGAAREQGCLSTYVAERRETLARNDVTSLDAPGTVRSWPEGMDRNAAKEER